MPNKPLTISLGYRIANVRAQGPRQECEGAPRANVTLAAMLEIDVEQIARLLVDRAANNRKGIAHIGGGAVRVRVSRQV